MSIFKENADIDIYNKKKISKSPHVFYCTSSIKEHKARWESIISNKK